MGYDALTDFLNTPFFQTALRLLMAMVCGGAIGLERELRRKPAGLRTNVLICMGAALLTITSRHISGGAPYTDPARLIAQSVTGIGFIGAGVIMQLRGSVTGLTTAATIFVVLAVGIAVGDGMFAAAALMTLLVVLVLVGLRRVEGWVVRRRRLYRYAFSTREPAAAHGRVLALLGRHGVRPEGFHVRDTGDGTHEVNLSLVTSPEGHRRLFDELKELGTELRSSAYEQID